MQPVFAAAGRPPNGLKFSTNIIKAGISCSALNASGGGRGPLLQLFQSWLGIMNAFTQRSRSVVAATLG